MITQTLVSDVVLFPEADREYALVSLSIFPSVCLSVYSGLVRSWRQVFRIKAANTARLNS